MQPMTTDPEEAERLLNRNASTAADAETEDVPPITVIDIDTKDGRGKRYLGSFYFQVPTLGMQIRIGQIKQAMLPGGSPDINATIIVDTLAYLQVCITFNEQHKKPSWWQPTMVYDATPFSALYRRCLDYEAKFHSGNALDSADAGEAGKEDRPERGRAADVGRKVRAPSERRETLAGDGSRGT